jgi:hypothetical protein
VLNDTREIRRAAGDCCAGVGVSSGRAALTSACSASPCMRHGEQGKSFAEELNGLSP